ncbi:MULTISPECIES: PhzF family phenazine biosynthesis protein [Methylosinus]|uniref:PhzF family phenazine biosynthesis protein n=1 Tax=Methylosinus sporium TaxID=428 RepID=A0A2U1SQA6_METSR|nr:MULTISPECIES: PhzF family phenazine biosynthesis protein [Methylosinus]MBU3888906.1 PhzF family phenazine biosynthesis protein [Methylosinus sp. KRF6]PWB93798.1 PhzF family phenazine biosynthesis protein [Methylosinus sporium]TRL29029.1 PhzF family phenazine biosynthesis protein [Methylosinus sporium]
MRLRFSTLDVFTNTRFAGNPLAVVLGADGLDSATMQTIACEFNLSETVFVLEPRDSINTARLRIFTPLRELPFAGHPTIGAAILLATQRAPEMLTRNGIVIALEEEIGLVRCDVVRDASRAILARFTAPRLPVRGAWSPEPAPLAKALGLESEEIGFGRHAPSTFSAGVELVFVPIRSRAALDRARPDPAAFAALLGERIGAYLYTSETVEPASAVAARMFANGVGIGEDPATGAAAAAFAGVAHAFEAPEDGEHEFVIEQGYAMGRPSRIILGSRIEAGALVAVTVAGHAVEVQRGDLDL